MLKDFNLGYMPDVHDTATRSYNMSRIGSINTKPEILVRKFLHANGFRYIIHDSKLPGKPDIVFTKIQNSNLYSWLFLAWTCELQVCKISENKFKLLEPKIINNISKDKQHIKSLKQSEWKVIVLGACKLKPKKIDKTFASLLKKISL